MGESIYEAGYSSSSRAYESGQDDLAMPPKSLRKGAAGITTQYGLAECYLGWLGVAATEQGICAIEFGDEPAEAVEQLQAHFPKAVFKRAGKELAHFIREVVACLETPQATKELPLDIQGTSFQQRVWEALRRIRPGETTSYAEIAEQIGSPSSIRAVARACAANKLAVVIPCHRVIYKNGQLSGYRWGKKRKRMLLERERQSD